MFKKICFFILITYANITHASVWDAFVSCIGDPCNCGNSNPDRVEIWNDSAVRTVKENANCPPWNKSDGRDNNTCVVQFDYPQTFSWWYINRCAEESKISTFFDPKITVRSQSCNAFACWTSSANLNWDGECVVWPTPWGLPLLRICARIALPADPIKNLPADPGYTYNLHLNSSGAEIPDEILLGVDGQPIPYTFPKLCAYADPSFLDIATIDGVNLDPMDFNPIKQPYHKTKELHPVAKVLVFFISILKDTGKTLSDLIGMLFDQLGKNALPGLDLLKPLFDFLGQVIQFIGDAFEDLIKSVGSLNAVVNDYHFGCVKIPLGPYPPPFCPTIPEYVPDPSVQSVCTTDPNTTFPVESTMDHPCVISKLRNNFIYNTVRVTYDNFIPICKSGQNPATTDKCIIIDNADAYLSSAEGFHNLTPAKRDVIKLCSASGVITGAPCIRGLLANNICSSSSTRCEGDFRIVYASKLGESEFPSGYYVRSTDLPDCSSTTTSVCQKVWGINSGQFIDVSLTFPAIENSLNITPLIQNFALQNTTGVDVAFTASIVRIASASQSNADICVSTADYQAGCVKRQVPTKPLVYDCASGAGGMSCSSNYFTPKFIALMQDSALTDTTGIVVAPLSFNDPGNTMDRFNLAGYEFSSYVTDNSFITKPFSGPKSPTPNSIFGNYKGGASPIDNSGNSTNAVYLNGLEYKTGQYISGGTFACLDPINTTRCPADITNCVLANLKNRDIVNCSDFTTKSYQYTGLHYCNSQDMNCNQIDNLPDKNGGYGATIYQCTGTYCYASVTGENLCGITFSPDDRVDPSPTLGIPISTYYNLYGSPSASYTTYLNTDVVSCSEFSAKTSEYIGMHFCTSSDTDCTNIDSIPGKNGGNGVVINKCANSSYCYTSDNNKPVCVVTITNGGYDKSMYAMRNKTSLEQNLCVAVPQPSCPAITTSQSSDNYALWGATNIGLKSVGICPAGLTPIDSTVPLERYCLINRENRTVQFEPLSANIGCQ